MSSISDRIRQEVDSAIQQTLAAASTGLTERIDAIEYFYPKSDPPMKKFDGNESGTVLYLKEGDGTWHLKWEGDDVKFIEYGYGARGAKNPYPGNPWPDGAGYGSKGVWGYPIPDEKTKKPYSLSYGHKGTIAPLYHEEQAMAPALQSNVRKAILSALRTVK